MYEEHLWLRWLWRALRLRYFTLNSADGNITGERRSCYGFELELL